MQHRRVDNASFHTRESLDSVVGNGWDRIWFCIILYYLPPYSPEFNRIEILWKQAKYFWRRIASLKGGELLDEIESLMKDF